MERVKVYGEGKRIYQSGVGLFARMFMDHFPLLPVEDDGRLHDPVLRENFIERIFVYRRWRNLLGKNGNVGGLVHFHTDHKLLIMAHSPAHYREMGRLVAHARELPVTDLFPAYEKKLLEALSLISTTRKNTNVLQHMMGYFKKMLDKNEKQELLTIIEQYRKNYIPLIVPITLINHYVRKYNEPYLKKQHYLNPHPIELQLRNHV